jgi:peptidoglycan/LPS O-acetylase OafA/YrhL
LIAVTGWLNAHTHVFAQMWGGYVDILIGCLAALLLHERRIYDKLSVLGRTPAAWAVFAAAAIALTSPLTGTQFGERYFSLLAAVAMMAISVSDEGPAHLFTYPWLTVIGAWSYGIYLFHLMVYDLVNTLIPAGPMWNYLTMPANLLIVVPLARFLHRHYEKPMIAFGRSLAAAPGGAIQAALRRVGASAAHD